MTVHFIGAGPGVADLITVRGRDLIRRSPVVLYAGSLVPPEIVAEAGAEACGAKHAGAECGGEPKAAADKALLWTRRRQPGWLT